MKRIPLYQVDDSKNPIDYNLVSYEYSKVYNTGLDEAWNFAERRALDAHRNFMLSLFGTERAIAALKYAMILEGLYDKPRWVCIADSFNNALFWISSKDGEPYWNRANREREDEKSATVSV